MRNLTNIYNNLKRLRRDFERELPILDEAIKDIEELRNLSLKCPRCASRDIRAMKYDRVFCKVCGFISPKKGDTKNAH